MGGVGVSTKEYSLTALEAELSTVYVSLGDKKINELFQFRFTTKLWVRQKPCPVPPL